MISISIEQKKQENFEVLKEEILKGLLKKSKRVILQIWELMPFG